MNKINWGIIGLGNIANKFAEGFYDLSNAKVKAIASQKENKLVSFKKKFKIEDKFCFKNYDDLISCPDIDIIYIALPNSLHARYIINCINHKKNILIEKPAVTNVKDLLIISELVANNKIYFTEGFMYRYLPYFKKIKEIIKNNLLGKVIEINSTFNAKIYKQRSFFGIKFKKPDYSSRLFNKGLGGGAILDLGCYPLSLSTFVNSLTFCVDLSDIRLEKVDTLYCESGVDIFSKAVLNFNDKFKSKITCSFKDTLDQSTKIIFENGSLHINETWTPKQNMTINLINNHNSNIINFKNNDNIYSYQIQSISEQLLNKKITPSFPSMSMKEIEINTSIMESWINFK